MLRTSSARSHRSAAQRAGRGRPAVCWATVLWRAFWAVMLVGHLPLWVTLTGAAADSAGQGVRWLILTASQLFFLLKIVDPAWLRLPRERRVWLAAILVILLLHGDVVRHVTLRAAEYELTLLATIAGSAVLAALFLALVERVLVDAARLRAHRAPFQGWWTRLARRTARPRYVVVRAARGNRAPPSAHF